MGTITEIKLDGSQVKIVERDEDENIVSAVVSFGKLKLPLIGEDAKALRHTITMNRDPEIIETLGLVNHHYYLDTSKFDWSEEFKYLSIAIGTNWFEVAQKMAVMNEDPKVAKVFSEGKHYAKGVWL
ncbi:hypothetical protein GR11A_00216 [Vibrio phage vB_VcorM_GR11A]|nr:hypothetical protein GR11A_00216 [Vibrio phage vB_VcorM_GR11A]